MNNNSSNKIIHYVQNELSMFLPLQLLKTIFFQSIVSASLIAKFLFINLLFNSTQQSEKYPQIFIIA